MTGTEQKHSGVWILAEQANGEIQRISYELLTRGKELAKKRGTALTALIMGNSLGEADLQKLISCGADRVIAVEAPELTHFLPEPYSACMLRIIDEYRPEIIIAGATSTGRTLMPFVAIRANAGLTADCTVLDIEADTGNLLQTRPAIGGNILATIKTPAHRPQMATVRPRSTKPASRSDGRVGEIIRLAPPPECLASRVRRVGFVPDDSPHSLGDADVVVAVGRGIKKADNVALARPLCESLDAAMGASRDAIDRGWLGYSHQVGLSGKTVSPKLYIALGISGAIQHLAGMQTSETIIAVNTDPEAQIFNVADFGIVGDLFEILPSLVDRINQAKSE